MLGGGGGLLLVPPHFCWGGGDRGSKKSAPQFLGPQGEPAHGLHPRFVVAEIWADKGNSGGGGAEDKAGGTGGNWRGGKGKWTTTVVVGTMQADGCTCTADCQWPKATVTRYGHNSVCRPLIDARRYNSSSSSSGSSGGGSSSNNRNNNNNNDNNIHNLQSVPGLGYPALWLHPTYIRTHSPTYNLKFCRWRYWA